ncbi:MAG: amino acid permease [Mycoplasmatales bacterium]
MSDKKQLLWTNVALMSFTAVWGFGNVVNNYANQGLEVIFSWIFIMLIYFIPYCLMVGELGSVFSDSEAGVSSWIKSTVGKKWAYFAAWTYWVVHVPYISQKPQSGIIALGWLFNGNGDTVKDMDPVVLSFVCLVIFLFFVFLVSRGISSLKILGTLAGSVMFVMGILYTIMALAAIPLFGQTIATTDLSIDTFIPTINLAYFTTFSMLVFAVGGIEKLSPYAGATKDAKKGFPKAMIACAIMVIISAIGGSIAMGAMFDAANIPNDLKMNGAYYAFQMLGEWYGLGHLFMWIYAAANATAQFTVLMISIDAPLKILVMAADKEFVPTGLTRVNKHGMPTNAYKLLAVLVGVLIMLPAFGMQNVNSLFEWLLDLNSIVMPIRYLWVFVAYFALKSAIQSGKVQNTGYTFVKNANVGKIIAGWCFAFTAFACILGMAPEAEAGTSAYTFELVLNVLTPFVLIGLGIIMPLFARKLNY